jgi:hypothetical protein
VTAGQTGGVRDQGRLDQDRFRGAPVRLCTAGDGEAAEGCHQAHMVTAPARITEE